MKKDVLLKKKQSVWLITMPTVNGLENKIKKELVAIKSKRFFYSIQSHLSGWLFYWLVFWICLLIFGFMQQNLNSKNKDFFQDVYDVVRLIPHGRATSYGAIANYLGAKQGARMVGWAMNASHVMPDVPAHRVVNRNGVLSGKNHFENPSHMEELLSLEGIRVRHDQIQDFEKVFWDPSIELGLP
jgi:methylated-DNA-protein-cysteine methyltransferase-like protein